MLKISNYFGELGLHRDSHIADLGAGTGTDAKTLSELVPLGKIYAVDVHKDLLEHLETDILKEKKNFDKKMENSKHPDESLSTCPLQNIVPVWGDIENISGTRLRDSSIDFIILSNTFFLLKNKKSAILEMKRILKNKGKILLSDWHKHLGASSNHKELVLSEKQVENMFSEIDMKVHPLVEKDDYHFVLIIEK